MLAVEKWSQGKHPIIGMIAPVIASYAPDLHEIYSSFKDHKINNRATELPDLPTWYSLYRNHNRYADATANFLLMTSTSIQEMEKFGAHVMNLQKDLKNSPRPLTEKEAAELQEKGKNLHKTIFEEVKNDIEDTPMDEEKKESGLNYLNDHRTELLFCFFVLTPCVIFYKTNPGRLYHRARLGEVKAIDALLRLDPLVLHDPAIGKQIQKIRLFGKRSAYVNLVEAPLKPIKAKINKSRIKAILGSLISMFAAELGAPVTSTDLRKLFDASAYDAKRHLIDTALPKSDEAFYKLLQRNRDDWKKIIPPGQKKVKVVSG